MTKQYELDTFWLHLIRSYNGGKTAQPPYMGISNVQYNQLFDDLTASEYHLEPPQHHSAQRETYQVLFSQRQDEFKQLVDLMTMYKNEQRYYSEQAALVIACTCLGYNHLWSDLGLPDRKVLGQMIEYYFPKLHQLNQNNMRWKRFFYRQLCENGGDYVCRSPSCEECVSYDECFN